MSIDILQEKIFALRNPSVVGLDPKPEYIPADIMEKCEAEYGPTLRAAAEAYRLYGKGLIDALWDVVPAVKPQAAYYEALGPDGYAVLKDTCDYAREKGMYVILDAKRGDIGTTAEAYSRAYLGTVEVFGKTLEPFGCDSLTVNTYLGTDGIKPFYETCLARNRAIFALVKTSNPSSGELQDLAIDGKKVYERAAERLTELSVGAAGRYGYGPIGAVVGATYPEELSALRKAFPSLFFLVPGYGAQGGSADDVKGAFDKNGGGAVVNSSRGIICAYKKRGGSFDGAARDAALEMREALRKAAGL
ncbi:MAG: orotidine-5'-phosphate decarboxylase [Oscillospiraceae bacterium]|nr:orotidine-5'-phosphate decarboxylase [Oscillospiraceae bacterium]